MPKGTESDTRAAFEQQSKVLAGLETALPDPWKTEIGALRKEFDLILNQMPPADNVPPAPGVAATTGLESLTFAVSHLLSINEQMTAMLKNMRASADTQLSGIPDRVTAEIQAKITAGELLTKETAEAAKTEAVNIATTALQERAKVMNARRGTLIAAELPLPNDDILAAEPPTFDGAQKEAIKRLGELKQKQISLSGAPLADLLWSPPDRYTHDLQLMSLAVAGRAQVPDPMLGTGAAAGPAIQVLVC